MEPGLYLSITDAIIALIQERHNHSESCITVIMPRRTQKVETYHANEGLGLAFSSMDPGHVFGSNVGNEFGVMLRRKRTTQTKICLRHCPHTLSPDI